MKKFLLAVLLCGFASTYAQITFEKGYFINNNGKRTECYIENIDWRNNPTMFNYKSSLGDSDVKMENIMGVSEFGIDNESMYKRFEVDIERSQNATSYLQKSKNPIWKSEKLFLQALVTGEANLYTYVDGNITKYFYETKSKPIEQLVCIKYMGADSGSRDGINSYNESIQQNNQFRQQLLNSVNCNMSEKDFSSLDYNRKSLVKHFVAYNTCAGNTSKAMTNYDAAAEGKREYFALRVQVGAYSAKSSISDPQTYYNKSTDLSQVIFKGGIEAEYILPFNKGAWSLFVNPTYQKFSPTKNYTGYIQNPGFANDGDPVHYTAKIDYSSIEIPIGLRRYFFINSASKIFVNAAYVIDISSGGTLEFSNSEGLVNAAGKFDISSRNNFALGLGYSYKRFSGEIRLNTARNIMSGYISWKGDYSTTGLVLGYKIL